MEAILKFFFFLLIYCPLVLCSNIPTLRIGTRASPLALEQAILTKRLLTQQFPELALEGSIEIVKIMTQGDSILNEALTEIGGKGLFTKALDEALLNQEVDICVHSMKDVPTSFSEDIVLPCYLHREETNDVFISKKFKSLNEVPDGAVIGSSSLRRQAQLLALNPTFKVITFRGNVQTRLRKIDQGEADGTMLALAGLKRLRMSDVIEGGHVLSTTEFVPAVAQGAIGIQCRKSDARMLRYLRHLNHVDTQNAVECERSFLETLDGNCRTPIAGYAVVENGKLSFRGMISKPDGTDKLEVSDCGSAVDAVLIGKRAGMKIKSICGEDKFREYQLSFAQGQTAGKLGVPSPSASDDE